MKRHRLVVFVFILCCIAIHKCRASCAKLNELQSLKSIQFGYPHTYSDYTDSYHPVRPGRQLTKTDYVNSEFVTHTRNPRGVTGSREHLKLTDAHQVANYFLSGGPLRGHDHFVRARDCDSDNSDNNDNKNNVDGTSNPVNESGMDSSANEEKSNNTDSIVGSVHIPRPHPILPPPHPILPPPHPILPPLHPTLLPPLSPLSGLTLGHTLLKTLLHPNLHPHVDTLHELPGALVKSAALPLNSLMHARTELRNMLPSKDSLLGSTNKELHRFKPRKILKHPPIVGLAPMAFHNGISPPLSHPPPTGYIVRYVPHNKPTSMSSIVGSPEQSSNYTDNLNTEESVTESTNNEDQG